MQRETKDQIEKNRLRVKTSIDIVRFLSFQGIAFRGHDERVDSRNRGNFLELLKYTASYNKEVENCVGEKAPKNAKYTSPDIQKEILALIAEKVRKKIVQDIGDSKFCIIVDESSDENFLPSVQNPHLG
ncbi:zinc finger MYM-type protein 1 [Artemisia annua]|uniref:Zinc finger MYM-type protein 1 n=1 Tax=Artemisia annua TaxID=35608 RepID=A0A2U1NAD4_ARTAN|nr:zinc finger MYM-type protein 1 [Artemisia annua]